MKRIASPTHNTSEVEAIIITQVTKSSGTVRNTAPPNCTIRNCPTKIASTISYIPYDLEIPLKAESVVPNTRALKRFQNCSITKNVKNIVKRSGVIPPSA